MITPKNILDCLRDTHFPRDKRRSTQRDANDEKKGFVMGYAHSYSQGWVPSRKTRKHPELAKMLCAFCKQKQPDFKVGSIMVNLGSSALHVDMKNCGRSFIMSLGDHTGGQLWQYPNRTLNIHNKLKECDGLLPHITLPFEGERYSIVFFNSKGNRAGPSHEDRRFLTSLGFGIPSKRQVCESPRTDLLESAYKTLRSIGVSKKFIGDYNNDKNRPAKSLPS
jgi:hypothetical protein